MGNYDAARTIALALLSNKQTGLTTDDIRNRVHEAFSHFPDTSDAERVRLVRELEATFQTVIGHERELVGEDEGWEPWLPARRGTLTWDYWRRYKDYLAQGPMNTDVRGRLDDSTDRVLGFLGDPSRKGSWDRRGLVVGLVQSGKTSHYIGLINKAVDAGYQVIIVLTGFTESLRVQTQIRAEEGFLGYYLEPGQKKGELRSISVGVGAMAPDAKPNSVTTRRNDFKKNIASNFGIQVGGKEILFVVKKNVGVLRNLLSWVESCGNATDASGRQFVRDVPLLVIDDESDVGSIDTKKGNIVDDDPDPEHLPSRINEQIRILLSLFDQSSYVGYTATPFANVLIHDGGWTEGAGDDLFPRSFIVSLPTPSDHIGPSMVFGRESDKEARVHGLPVVRHIPSEEAEGEAAWIPPVHKKHHRPSTKSRREVPPSLREAILSFVLVSSARRLRGSKTQHNSMLVHVTRFNDVQAEVAEQVRNELAGVVDRLRARTASEDLLRELRDLWNKDFVPTTREISEREGAIFQNPPHEWEELELELLDAAAAIEVRIINGLAAEVLDYEQHAEDGLSVIAIGGDKLSRGLTLEGLSVSYFLRCSRMYDTLMQMGRWFGYRPGYLDLCRIYTTAELCEWFGHIADATEELRDDFNLMANSGGTPKDFGLRVRSHPELMVTSQVKMRHGENIPITFQGKFVETDNFYRDAATIEANWTSLDRLVTGLDSGGGNKEAKSRPNSSVWCDVSRDAVVSFLANYKGNESATKARPEYLIEYIEKEALRERLLNWTVMISGGSKGEKSIGDTSFRLVHRGWKLMASEDDDRINEKQALIAKNQFRIGILISPLDEQVDLGTDQIARARAATIEDWERDPRGRSRPKDPAGRFLRQERDAKNGLLIIYPLHPDMENSENGDVPLVGFVISFPAFVGRASNVIYTVNNVYQQLELNYQ